MVVYNVVGVMSGTSGDGLDLALCEFTYDNHRWQYSIKKAETVPHPGYWLKVFDSAVDTKTFDFIKLHNAFGAYIGDCVNRFLAGTGSRVDLIASHGHTVCHRPDEGITFQLGSGNEIAACCKITTVSDFRSLDVALKGQGAPLVPAGDELLFGEYDFCLNLGGFANISFREDKARRAFDVCPVNIIINKLANDHGHKMDRDGQLASRGSISHPLLGKLNGMEYYSRPFPKSLSREWLISAFMPVVNEYELSTEDKLRTVCEHITMQIADCMDRNAGGKVLVTGGGAFNKFLVGLLKQKCNCKFIIPDKKTVKFKEALVFGLLGVLRLRNEINCLSSATGSLADTSSGTIIYFNPVTK
jgi:anhydro-N-acetylmuramic acid kinase